MREEIPLEIAPNEPGLGEGRLVYYVNGPTSIFASRAYLGFYSIPTMEASTPTTVTGGRRYAIRQFSGESVEFDLSNTGTITDATKDYFVGLPRGENAFTQNRLTYTVASTGLASAWTTTAKLRQYLPGGGFVDFPTAGTGGRAVKCTTPSGRVYDFTASPFTDTFEIIRQKADNTLVSNGLSTNGVLRQVRTAAGLLDIVRLDVKDGGGIVTTYCFEVRKYTAGQFNTSKDTSGTYKDLYSIKSGETPLYIMNVSSAAAAGNQVTITRTQGAESYTTVHTVSALSGGGEKWVQNHTNGDFQFTRTLERTPTGSSGETHSEWTGKLTQVPSSSGVSIAPFNTSLDAHYKLVADSRLNQPGTSTETFSVNATTSVTRGRTYTYNSTAGWDAGGIGGTATQGTSTGSGIQYGYDTSTSQPDTYLKMVSRDWTIYEGSTPKSISEDYAYDLDDSYSIPARFDFRPRMTVNSIGGTTVSRKFDSYGTVSGEYTEIHEDDLLPGKVLTASTYGTGRRSTDHYYGSTYTDALTSVNQVATVSRGRLRASIHTDGTRTDYTYMSPGVLAGTTTPAAVGEFEETIDDRLSAAGAALDNVSLRVVNHYDIRGCLLWAMHYRRIAGAWKDYELFELTWDKWSNITKQTRTDRLSGQVSVLLEQDWDGARLMRIGDETGVSIRYTYFPSSIIVKSVKREQVPASGSIPAQPEVITTYTGTFTMNASQMPVWKNLTTTVSAAGIINAAGNTGTLSLVTATVLDELGRIVSLTDSNGYTTTLSYTSDGKQTTTTYSSGATCIETRASDGTLLSITGTAQVAQYYVSTPRGGDQGGMTHTTFIGSLGGQRWEKEENDGAGRIVKSSRPSSAGSLETIYNYSGGCACGKPDYVTTTGLPTTVYIYNSMGDLVRSGQTSSSSTTLTLVPSAGATPDIITDHAATLSSPPVTLVLETGSTPNKLWEVTENWVYPNASSSTRVSIGKTRRLIAGFNSDQREVIESIDMAGNTSTSIFSINRAALLTTGTVKMPGVSDDAVTISYAGRIRSSHQPGSGAATVVINYNYDALGRIISTKLPHHANPETRGYTGSLLTSVSNAAGDTTNYEFYPAGSGAGTGLLKKITAPNGTATTKTYNIKDQLVGIAGNTYPIIYDYNGYGELWKMTTKHYDNALSSDISDVTTWNWDSATGLLLSKTDAAGSTVSYTYDASNRVKTRVSPRAGAVTVTATLGYHPITGGVSSRAYTPTSVDMPIEGLDYDRLGRVKKMTSGIGNKWEYSYDNSTLLLDTETSTLDVDNDGVADFTRVLDRSHDSYRRPSGWNLKNGGSSEYGFTTTYETVAGRPSTFSGSGMFFTGTGNTFTYSWKPNAPDLLESVSNGSTAITSVNTWESNRDILDWRQNNFGSTVISKYDYTVNSMGRRANLVETGTAYSGSPNVAWDYNTYGELKLQDHSNGSAWDSAYSYDNIGNRRKVATGGTTLPVSDNYLSNNQNQYTKADGVSTLNYDLDGNLTADAGANLAGSPRVYTWDGENRLIKVTPTGSSTPIATYRYDPQGRRYFKSSGGISTLFLYDGWNLIGEYSGTTPSLQRAHLWGLDISGSQQGAGGIGGLLCSSVAGTRYYPLSDGNGNICQYTTATGVIATSYEFGPFGQMLATAVTGSPPVFNFRFSSKYEDSETGLLYYGCRYYSSWMGRWISRDPMFQITGAMPEIDGEANLYGFVDNDPVDDIDLYGLKLCHRQRIDYKIKLPKIPPLERLTAVKADLSLTVRGQFTLCDDCTIELAGRLTAQFGIRIPIWPGVPGFSISGTASFELHGQVAAKWHINQPGVDGSGSLKMTGWGGLYGGGDTANIAGEIGFGTSWTFSFNRNSGGLNLRANGGAINFNARARIAVSWGPWKYNQEILRYTEQLGTAPSFGFSIPSP